MPLAPRANNQQLDVFWSIKIITKQVLRWMCLFSSKWFVRLQVWMRPTPLHFFFKQSKSFLKVYILNKDISEITISYLCVMQWNRVELTSFSLLCRLSSPIVAFLFGYYIKDGNKWLQRNEFKNRAGDLHRRSSDKNADECRWLCRSSRYRYKTIKNIMTKKNNTRTQRYNGQLYIFASSYLLPLFKI